MNMFIIEKSYVIKKIKSVADGWKLYPQDKKEKEIFISKQYYAGKMPFKFPWQTFKLDIVYVWGSKDEEIGFITSAVLDGNKLFEVPKEDYPEDVKKRIDIGEELNRKKQEHIDTVNKVVISELALYLPLVLVDEANLNLENRISKLNVDLRFYLKLHYFKGEKTPEYRQRVKLMIMLCSIAERMYKRHVNMDDCINVGLSAIGFDLFSIGYTEDDMFFTKESPAMQTYFEVDELLTEMLPPIENMRLRKYLNYVARDILRVFAQDYSLIYKGKLDPFEFFHEEYSDEKVFRLNIEKMQMPKFKSFILPKVFSDDEISTFKYNYNLK